MSLLSNKHSLISTQAKVTRHIHPFYCLNRNIFLFKVTFSLKSQSHTEVELKVKMSLSCLFHSYNSTTLLEAADAATLESSILVCFTYMRFLVFFCAMPTTSCIGIGFCI